MRSVRGPVIGALREGDLGAYGQEPGDVAVRHYLAPLPSPRVRGGALGVAAHEACELRFPSQQRPLRGHDGKLGSRDDGGQDRVRVASRESGAEAVVEIEDLLLHQPFSISSTR